MEVREGGPLLAPSTLPTPLITGDPPRLPGDCPVAGVRFRSIGAGQERHPGLHQGTVPGQVSTEMQDVGFGEGRARGGVWEAGEHWDERCGVLGREADAQQGENSQPDD